ncbi:hypothetical protein SERLA73DRAFT_125850 [Serpula lacrymans var. lacrymans S7.3]|uniref:Uncharacterized protein n=2 Tax=Serpula lacrymans var. lacrymans TaxID=341189 RepID=F8QAU9_SERL3|nr:uncharacterized protein SERLADRAFT_401009 [Serpula lacrymans var. lacrymans S7.9]EGN94335.1 hypothetical protein SERLA73DRAFT_125850 [Serpula lacrymans var. lacrymans S7.3]EGO19822.1 hypothetical protein SERLADRAFT_401009 [Serpula lacrymans var. lacrymans S7.9]
MVSKKDGHIIDLSYDHENAIGRWVNSLQQYTAQLGQALERTMNFYTQMIDIDTLLRHPRT